MSCGLLFLRFEVVSAGHVPQVPEAPRPGQVRYLREKFPVLNHLSRLVRRNPELGRLISSRTHSTPRGLREAPGGGGGQPHDEGRGPGGLGSEGRAAVHGVP